MRKIARKPSSDPAQERLRAAKEIWNKDVSAFIAENVLFRRDITKFNNDLIHFKKLMNGAANKFYMQRSYITHPVPADPVTISGSLSEDFNKFSQKASQLAQQFATLAQRANDISNQQIEYSKTRRKKTNESSPSTQLSLPGIGANLEYELIAEASNPFSRFIARRTIPKYGDSHEAKIGRYRLNILKQAIALFKLVNKFQILCVSHDDDAMAKIAASFNTDILPKWDILSQTILLEGEQLESLNKIKPELPSEEEMDSEPSEATKNDLKSEEQKPKDLVKEKLPIVVKPEVLQESKSETSDIKTAIKEFTQSYSNPELFSKVVNNRNVLEKLFGAYKHPGKSPEEKNKAAEEFIKEWNKVKQEIKLASSMAEVDSYITKIAQESITKWIGKKKLERDAKTIQLSIYNNSDFIKHELDYLMNLVEDGFNFSEIKKIQDKINNYFSTIQSNLFTQKSIIKDIDPKIILETLESNIHGLTEEQKAKIETAMRIKRMKDSYTKVEM
jgi:hypothetical protein